MPPTPPPADPRDQELLEALGLAPPPPQPPPRSRVALPLLLFGLTCLSTMWFGAYGFAPAWDLFYWRLVAGPALRAFLTHPTSLLDGWTFTLPLMSILLCHEMGHYVTARIHGVRQSLPYFIPLPFGFGTLGAVIGITARIPNRNVLLDIGVMGPIMGMVVAIPVMVLGLLLSHVEPLTYPALLEGNSLLYWLLKYAVKGPIAAGWDVSIGNVALAGWMGFYLTMLNLFPIGQLDGGHVAYAILDPRRASPVYRLFNAVLFLNGLWLIVFHRNLFGIGFLLMGVLVAFFAGWHPPLVHPDVQLTRGRRVLVAVAAVLYVVTYVPVPWTLMDAPR